MQVIEWKEQIENLLKNQISRKPFDINIQRKKLLSQINKIKHDIMTLNQKQMFTKNREIFSRVDKQEVSLKSLLTGKPFWEMARDFVAVLQLVNEGKIQMVLDCQDKNQIKNSEFTFIYDNCC